MKSVALLLSLSMASACASTAYTPVESPYLKTVVVDSQLKYRVSGTNHRGGPLGDLATAVAAVPEAKAYAEEAESDAVWALVNSIVGASLMGLGTGLALATSFDDDTSTATTIGFTGLAVAGVTLMMVGLSQAVDAQINQLDAINIYNDVMMEQDRLRLRRAITPSASERAVDPVMGTPGDVEAPETPGTP